MTKTKRLEVGHNLTIGPWQIQDGMARRYFFCHKCQKQALLQLDLSEKVGNIPVRMTLQYVQDFEQQPCRS